MRNHELECVVKLFGFLRGRLYEPHAHDHARHDPSRCRMWFHIGDDTLRRAAVPNAKTDAKANNTKTDKWIFGMSIFSGLAGRKFLSLPFLS